MLKLPKLDAIRGGGKDSTHLDVLALVTLAAIERNAELRTALWALTEATAHAATPQVLNAAPLGGNIRQRLHCWYFRNEA
ncbi:FAD binding domain-containing protein [Hymenobacter weizhouensis]|uniref:FAD binding domain-containing protein n=1 Tax=Hymenobacter sp. YIM 151500-1 TaxID=2987689 RepID=UPI002227E2ED|nr:FAD binding domain-containing protein [Hymenobacter sp. YIM 151500-1]UYZ64638.1 FAD binding domain-containing protein [Hymenobacter sp. YIM 151500-1]